MEQEKINIPLKDRLEIRNKKIRDLFKLNYSMQDICQMLNVSRTTVFFAIKGRSKKKAVLKKIINN